MRSFDGMSDVDMLARIMDAEAGQEGGAGKLAVAAVIDNRRKVGGYGDDWRGVITKPGQFSAINDVTGYAGGKGANQLFWRKPSAESLKIAEAVVAGKYRDPTKGATHYFNPDHADPKWAKGKQWTRMGNHVFGNADAGRIAGGAGNDTLVGQGEAPQFDPAKYAAHKASAKQGAEEKPSSGGFDPAKYEAFKAQRRGEASESPEPKTTAPTALEGMDAPREPNFWERTGDAASRMIFGQEGGDFPEIETSNDGMMNVAGLEPPPDGSPVPMQDPKYKRLADLDRDLFLADGEEAMASIIQKYNPDAQIDVDDRGNHYVTVNGRSYSLDREGLSRRDLKELVKGVLYAGATMGGARIGAALGPVFRYAGAGVGAGAEQSAEQIVSNAVGGDQPFDAGRVLFGAAFGIGGEAIGNLMEHVGPRMMRAILGAKEKSTTRAEFEIALKAEGFTAEEVQDALSVGLQRTEAVELGPQALARIADAQALPAPVELTTGQATRSPGLFREEHSAGQFGDDVRFMAEGVRATQQDALSKNADILQGQFQAGADRGQRGAVLQNEVIRRRDEAWARVGDAYNRARKSPNQPVIPQNNLVSFIDDIQRRLRKEYTPAPDDVTQRMIADFRETISEGDVEIGELERWRSRAVRDRETAKGGDRAALNELIRSYDGAIQSGLPNGAIGDTSGIGMWRRAVRMRAEFGKTYENDSIVDRISSGAKKRRGEVEIDAENVLAELLGQSGFGRKGAAREARRLKQFLGKDSQEWAEVQAEGLVRLLGFEPSQFAGGNISTVVVNNLRKARKDHPDLLRAMFTQNQLSQIERFARVVETTSIRPMDAGTPNPSGSGLLSVEGQARQYERIERMAQGVARLFGRGGSMIGTALLRAVSGAGTAAQSEAMRRSLRGLPLVPKPRASAPGVGGVAGSQGAEAYFAPEPAPATFR